MWKRRLDISRRSLSFSKFPDAVPQIVTCSSGETVMVTAMTRAASLPVLPREIPIAVPQTAPAAPAAQPAAAAPAAAAAPSSAIPSG